jgi:hypothetical protein
MTGRNGSPPTVPPRRLSRPVSPRRLSRRRTTTRRVSTEGGNIDRITRWRHNEATTSSVLRVTNPLYLEHDRAETSDTRPLDEMRHILIYDDIDTFIDVLMPTEPILAEQQHRYSPLGTVVGLKTDSPDIEPRSLMIIGQYQADTGTGKLRLHRSPLPRRKPRTTRHHPLQPGRHRVDRTRRARRRQGHRLAKHTTGTRSQTED